MNSQDEIRVLERSIAEQSAALARLRAAAPEIEVPDYRFENLDGPVHLSALFGGHEHLLVIHNMGQGCRYCTLWADGFDGLLPHIEAAMAVVVASGDAPAAQRRFASSRGWRLRMVSHAGSPYLTEQDVGDGAEGGNWPGAVVYRRDGDRILRRNATVFGPGDAFCALWPLLSMAGMGTEDFTPQFRYWTRPETLLDGGANPQDGG